MVSTIRKKKNQKGFTLLELLIVIAILGILASMAIQQFYAYKLRSYRATAQADARYLANAQEAYYVDNGTYCANIATLTTAIYGAHLSANSTCGAITVTTGASASFSYVITNHGQTATYDSATGGLL